MMKKELKLKKSGSNEEYNVEVVGGDLVRTDTGEIVFAATKTLNIVETANNELAIGLAVPSTWTTPTDYLKGLDEYKLVKDKDMDTILEVCDNMYRYEGVVGAVVDLYVELANTDLIIQDVENDEARKVLNYYNDHMNENIQVNGTGINAFLEQGMTHHLVFGNSFPYANWRDVRIDGTTYNLPINVIYMNPHNIHIDEDLIPLGIEDIRLEVPERLLNKQLPEGTPEPDALRQIRDVYTNEGRTPKFGNVLIPLDPTRVTHIKRKARDWEAWGIPHLLRAFSAVSSKKRLRRLDDATTEGLVNYLTVFKIGATDSKSVYHKVSQNRLNAFASLIKNPTAATTLVWTHDLQIETVGPDNKVLEFADKYDSVNKDIIGALGIGALLLNDGSASDESVLVLVEILENIRSVYLSYVTKLYNQILEENGIKSEFKVKFSNIKLSDLLQQLKNHVLSYYDRGLLSYETALTLGGHEFAQEVDRKRKEKEVKDEGLFDVPNLPFSTDNDGQSSPTNDDGRPTDNTDDNDIQTVEDESNAPSESRSYEWSRADEDFVQTYSSVLLDKLVKIKDRLITKAENNSLREVDINLALTAGFADMSRFSDDTLNGVFESIAGELTDINENTIMRQQLNSWTYGHIVKIRDSLFSKLSKATKDISGDQTLIVPAIETVFAKHERRLEMFGEQSYIKAKVASFIEVKTSEGMAGAVWKSTESDCEICLARNENFYKPSDLFKIYPAHPGCNCEITWSKSNAIVDGTAPNSTVVVNTRNLGKPL